MRLARLLASFAPDDVLADDIGAKHRVADLLSRISTHGDGEAAGIEWRGRVTGAGLREVRAYAGSADLGVWFLEVSEDG